MKKLLFFFILSITISEVFASDATKLKDSLVIGNSTLEWKSDRIVEDIDNNIIYISFNNDEELKIYPRIVAYKDLIDGTTRTRTDRLNQLMYANEAIFIGAYKTNEDGKTTTKTKDAEKHSGTMVNDCSGNDLSRSHIIIKKGSLPTLTFNEKEYKVKSFDNGDDAAQKAVWKNRLRVKLPEADTINISKDTLKNDIPIPVIDVKNNKVEIGYTIDGRDIEPNEEGDIIISKDSLASKGTINVYYCAEYEDEYFGHKIENRILTTINITSEETSLCGVCNFCKENKFLIWGIAGIIILALLVFILRKRITNFIDKKKQTRIDKDRGKFEQEYRDRLNDNEEEKISLLSSLLSNIDNDFKQRVLQILNLEATPDSISKEPHDNPDVESLNAKIATLETMLKERDEQIEKKIAEMAGLQSKLSKAIEEKQKLKLENENLKQNINELNGEIASLRSIIEEKLQQISLLQNEIARLKNKLSSIDRQNMYLLQIDDTLKEVSEDILDALKDVEEGELKRKLVHPILNGVKDVDEGVTTYYSRWRQQVMNNPTQFFGKDLYEMTNSEVKTKLVSSFLKNLAQGDTFSKLAKLYMYIQADWINEILIGNKFNVDKIEQIFNRLTMLFNDFGIEIIYPRLFVDRMNDQIHTFDSRCDVFRLFSISEEMRLAYSKENDLIVDIIQVGVKIQSLTPAYNRKAIVSIPNF
ncbi:MAG: hypothetical protein E7143_02250 [Rikenellaceae bacterium]|nr:hypothetical protein [Rikenellaceae bacterium]